FTLKSGCAVERLQLETRARLERALAVYTGVAARLLRTTFLARPRTQPRQEAGSGRPARPGWPGGGRRAAAAVAQCAAQATSAGGRPGGGGAGVYGLGGSGGYVGRGAKARPGVKVLWRGLRRLHDLLAGYELAQPLPPQPPPD